MLLSTQKHNTPQSRAGRHEEVGTEWKGCVVPLGNSPPFMLTMQQPGNLRQGQSQEQQGRHLIFAQAAARITAQSTRNILLSV